MRLRPPNRPLANPFPAVRLSLAVFFRRDLRREGGRPAPRASARSGDCCGDAAHLGHLGNPDTPVSEHLSDHLTVMSKRNKQRRYDRMTDDYLKLTGEPPTNMRDFVTRHAANITRSKAAA